MRTTRLSILTLGVAAALVASSSVAAGQAVHATIRLGELEGEADWSDRTVAVSVLESHPDVRLHGAGEAFLAIPATSGAARSVPLRELALSIRLPAPGAASGTLLLPEWNGAPGASHAFRVDVDAADDAARASFLEARLRHYSRLQRLGLPGAAWFRHESDAARAELAGLGVYPELGALPAAPGRRRPNDLQDSYDLLTGGRALSENLQLDRVLEPEEDYQWVPLTGLTGITTREMDWTELVRGIEPELDPLARLVPFDQHAAFFPSFGAFTRVLDEVRAHGAPILELFEASAEDARTRERYERQLCLRLDAATRLVGGAMVASVAATGGDPYLRTGSDVALLFEARAPEVLHRHILGQHALAVRNEGAEEVSGRVLGHGFTGVRTPDRSVHSLVLALGDVVVVSNSRVQLERIARLADDDGASLARLDEYRFFRHRYARSAPDETAFVVISDATIRRWCGPEWRIGASRRTRAAAVLSDHAARLVSDRAAGRATEPSVDRGAELRIPGGGAVVWDDDGARSEVYGTTDFLTPISELAIDAVTVSEKEAYEQFRDSYQRRWRRFFDPVAARVTVAKERLALDLTVMPLIDGSDYRDLMETAGASRLDPEDGDRHAGAVLHFAMALDRGSWLLEYVANALRKHSPRERHPLAWLGDGFAVYVDADPILEEWAASEHPGRFWSTRTEDMPIGAFFESTDERRLTGFMTAVRSYIEGDGPAEWAFETRVHRGREYMAIVNSVQNDTWPQPFFAIHPDGLTVTFNEGVVRRAIERAEDRGSSSPSGESFPLWLGESLAVDLEEGATALLRSWWGRHHHEDLRRVAWSALPILNEWQRLFPDEDPLAVHARGFGVRLVCPVGTGYEWDAEWETWSSTAFGHPAAPREGRSLSPAIEALKSLGFGLTFEHEGLRARVEIER